MFCHSHVQPLFSGRVDQTQHSVGNLALRNISSNLLPSKWVCVDNKSVFSDTGCQSINEVNHENMWPFYKIEGFAGKRFLPQSTTPCFVDFCSCSNLRSASGKCLCTRMLATQASENPVGKLRNSRSCNDGIQWSYKTYVFMTVTVDHSCKTKLLGLS